MQGVQQTGHYETLYNPKQERALLRAISGGDHDNEWYPTTPEMLKPVLEDIIGDDFNRAIECNSTNPLNHFSLLDICAGNGSVFYNSSRPLERETKNV
jgi:hypothetical protein